MNIAQLHERVKDLSDGQLANLSQRGDMTASLALAELNTRNDMREASAMQMGKAPTIAEQERAKAMQGIGAPPIDPSMVTPEMLAGIGNPAMMPQPQPVGAGVGQLEAPMMMARGGLIELAAGDLVGGTGGDLAEEYPRPTGPSRLDQATEWVGDTGSDLFNWAKENPGEALSYGLFLVPGGVVATTGLKAAIAGGKGLYGLAKKGKLLDKGLDTFFGVKRGKLLQGPVKPGAEPLGRVGQSLSRPSIKRSLATAAGSKLGIEGLDYLTEPTDIGVPSIETPATEIKLTKEAKAKAKAKAEAAAKAAAKADKDGEAPPAVEKGGLGGLLANISPEAWQGLGLAGAKIFSGDTVGAAAEKGIATTLAAKKQAADAKFQKDRLDIFREQLEVDRDKITASLGMKAADVEKARAKWLETPAAAKIINDLKEQANEGFFTNVNETVLARETDLALDRAFNDYLVGSIRMGNYANVSRNITEETLKGLEKVNAELLERQGSE